MIFSKLLIFIGMKPTPFEFIIDVPLEECSILLKGQEYKRDLLQHTFVKYRATSVDLNQLDHSEYEFSMFKQQPRGVPTALTGKLTSLSSVTTLVTGFAVSQHLLRQLAIILAMCLILFIATVFILEPHYPGNVFFGGCVFAFYLLLTVLTVVMTAIDRDWVINHLRESMIQ